jgi:hypothetical protein
MFTIDMTTIRPVGEFGSEAWCQACADYGTKILEQSDLPLDLSWDFSEIYTYPSERLIRPERSKSGYHFMIKEGAGLHNIAAILQTTSPEFSGLPTTVLGVPNFSRMSDQQKSDFIDLCGLKTSATS